MFAVFADLALLPDGFCNNVRLTIEDGVIGGIAKDTAPRAGDTVLSGRLLLPAPGNVHSHAFQRAMAGMTEYRSRPDDDFWSWRSLMYRFLDILTPDQVEAIAALVYVEMLEAGYAAVGEFHYLHHRPGGAAYDNIAEMSDRIFAAAQATGIGLTHLPVLYTFGGAGETPLSGGQKRFGCDLDRFGQLISAAAGGMRSAPADWAMGIAPHSIRATSPRQLQEIAGMMPNGPVHIHAAEQEREVGEVVDWLGARPVEWLLDNAAVDARWCLIHATRMTHAETLGLASSGAVAGLCPITEANLGDGIFNGNLYLENGGWLGVGSDSNVHISLTGELRQLEYSQRLKDRKRNVMVTANPSTGQTLFDAVRAGGARALGRNSGAIETDRIADLVAIDTGHLALSGLKQRHVLDGWIFASQDNAVTDVWSAGRRCVEDGRHVARDAVEAAYRKVQDQLREEL